MIFQWAVRSIIVGGTYIVVILFLGDELVDDLQGFVQEFLFPLECGTSGVIDIAAKDDICLNGIHESTPF
jgi:hypothetical protein